METTPEVLVHWRRNQAAVTVAAFIGFTGFTLVMPFLPLYFGSSASPIRPTSPIWSGVSLGVTPAITAAMAPVWARLADRVGRKLMVVRSLVSFVVIMSLMAFVTAPWQVFVLRAIQGLFAGYGAIAMTMAAESAPPEHWRPRSAGCRRRSGSVRRSGRRSAACWRRRSACAAPFWCRRRSIWSRSCSSCSSIASAGAARTRQPAEPAHASFASLRLVPHFTLFVATVFGLQLVDRSFGPVLPLYLVEIGLTERAGPVLERHPVRDDRGGRGHRQSGDAMDAAAASRRGAGAGDGAIAGAVAAFVFVVAHAARGPARDVGGLRARMGVATTAIYAAATHAVPPRRAGSRSAI